MLIFAVRSLGIIGGGAVLFGATALGALQTLAVAGELQIGCFWIILKLFRNWNGSIGSRRSCYSRILLASVLRCTDRPMLPSSSWTEGKARLPEIVLIVQKTPSACTDRVAMLPFESWLQRKASGFSFAQLH